MRGDEDEGEARPCQHGLPFEESGNRNGKLAEPKSKTPTIWKCSMSGAPQQHVLADLRRCRPPRSLTSPLPSPYSPPLLRLSETATANKQRTLVPGEPPHSTDGGGGGRRRTLRRVQGLQTNHTPTARRGAVSPPSRSCAPRLVPIVSAKAAEAFKRKGAFAGHRHRFFLAEKVFLEKLYEETEGPMHWSSPKWEAAGLLQQEWRGDVGDLSGVSTDLEGFVTSLDLRRRRLRGTMPRELIALTRLTTLNLHGNPHLVSPLPDLPATLKRLSLGLCSGLAAPLPPLPPGLTHIDVFGCHRLRMPVRDIFANALFLVVVNLEGCWSLTGELPGEGFPRTLEVLNMRGCGSIRGVLPLLPPALQYFSSARTLVHGTIPRTVGTYPAARTNNIHVIDSAVDFDAAAAGEYRDAVDAQTGFETFLLTLRRRGEWLYHADGVLQILCAFVVNPRLFTMEFYQLVV